MSIYYSCDSHVVEPPEVFEGLEGRFGERAPKGLRNERGDRTAVTLGGIPIPVGRFGIAGHRLDDLATHELIARGYEGLNQGVFDPGARPRPPGPRPRCISSVVPRGTWAPPRRGGRLP